MPDVKISQLPAATSATGGMELEVNDAGTSKKVTATQLKAFTDNHSHTIANVTGLQTALDGKAASSHTHAAADITSGELNIARIPEATAAQFRNNTADRVLSTDQVWAAAAEVALTDAATVAVDMNTGFNFSVTLAGNRTLGNPTNPKVGQTGRIRIVQDGTGSRTLSYSANWKFPGGVAPILSTAANAVDYLDYEVVTSTLIRASLTKDVK